MCKHLCRNSSCEFLFTKKGFTLIEVLCSVSLFSLLSISILTINLSAFKVKNYSEKLSEYNYFMEDIRNNFIYNYSSDKIIGFKKQGKFYISKNNIKISTLEKSNLEDLLLKNKPSEKPYLEIYIDEINTESVGIEESLTLNKFDKDKNENKNNIKLLKINFILNTDLKEKNGLIEYEVYKGTYKKQ